MAAFNTGLKVDEVHIQGLAVLKIVKHCNESPNNACTGSLLGLSSPTSKTLEITSSFPFPNQAVPGDGRSGLDADGNPIIIGRGGGEVIQQAVIDEDGNVIDPSGEGEEGGNEAAADAQAAHTKLLTSDQFQIEMMKMLRELNVDNNCVGWYQSSHLGSYHAQTLIDTQIAYQNDLGENSVVIVYDAVSTRSGSLGLKAYRLTSNFVKAKEARRNEFVAVDDMFEEIPVVIKNGGLVRGLLYDLGEEEGGKFDFGAERLKMESSGFLEKSLQNITHYVEDLNAEHSSMSKYSRSLMRMEGGRWDKNTREKTEKKTVDKHSKWVGNEEAPTRLNALIYNKQIGTFCDNVDRFADTQMEKLFLTGAAQKGN